jgi:hypothetical protein
MNLRDLIRYLFGYRDAIDKIANCPNAFWVGLAFTILAAVARDYDGVYLIGQPYHLLVPLAASVSMATVLYGFLWFSSWPSRFRISYKLFLTYFWLMAPMAWIYAIPVERMMSAVDAARANLWFLAIVALWRVLLITRVVAVRQHISFIKTLIKVLFVATTIVIVAIFAMPKPVFSIMGGVRLNEQDQLILNVSFATLFFGSILWIVLAICLLVMGGSALTIHLGKTENKEAERGDGDSPLTLSEQTNSSSLARPVGNSLWGLIGFLLLISFGLLAWGQPEQRLRYQVENRLKANQLVEGLNLMSENEPVDFPPFWAPPPSISYNERTPDPIALALAALESDQKNWVRQAAIRPFVEYFRFGFFPGDQWRRLPEPRFKMALAVLEAIHSFDQVLVKDLEEGLRAIAKSEPDREWQKELAEDYFRRHGKE